MARPIATRYRDPLDQVWTATAARVGLRLDRSREVNAATDGDGRLTLGAADTLDADDCLAQMIFHELCHSLIEGEDSFARRDWGLDNVGDGDDWREHACLRLQAVLAGRYGLRRALAPTTDFRAFYDALPADPLADRRDRSVIAAIAGLGRVARRPWGPHLEEALAATAAIAAVTGRFATPGAPSLLDAREAPPAPHPSGLPGSAADDGGCGACGWRDADGRCVQADRAVEARWPRCERFEPAVDCQTCGACCREGYDSVTVEADDPVVARHPALVVRHPTYLEIRRAGGRCAVLSGDLATPYACAIYPDRPRCCRELEAGGEHCLTARRRVGLSL